MSHIDRRGARISVADQTPSQPQATPARSRGAAALAWRCAFAIGVTVVVVALAEITGRAARTVGAGSSTATILKIVSGVSLGALAGYYSRQGIEFIRRDLHRLRHFSDR